MFSTICLLFLSGFILWMNTSGRINWPDKSRVMARMASTPRYCRYAAGTLFLIATIFCVVTLGWGSGLFAAIVILMTTGSAAVLFFPFRYFSAKTIMILYVCALGLELIIC